MRAFIKKYNTLHNQMFLLFSVVSLVIISAVTLIGYNKFSSVYDEIVQAQLEQTSVELNSAIDAKYSQVSMIASQVSTDEDIQNLMYQLLSHPDMASLQAQTFKRTLNRYYPYVESISDYRFYALDGTGLFPASQDLTVIIDDQSIQKALDAKGQLIWVGQDSKSHRYSYAIKVIRLMNHSYENSGFLVLKLSNEYFDTQFGDTDNFIQIFDHSKQFLTGKNSSNVLLTDEGKISIDDEPFYVVKSVSPRTEWTIYVAQSMESYNLKIQKIQLFLVGIALIGVVLGFLLSWIIASYITSPLKQLIEAMRKGPKRQLLHIEETNSSLEMHTLHHTYNQFITDIERLIEEVYEKQLLQQQAELKALQSQINPHFLYNTLNTFYWKLIDDGKDELADYVLSMSALFKYSVSASTTVTDVVTLEQELEQVEHYLNLMKMRLDDRLTWRIQCEPELKSVQIPKLILQPFIENAIIHGIEPQRTKGIIDIKICSKGPHLLSIIIQDNGKGMPATTLENLNKVTDIPTGMNHIGIHNIRLRLAIHYSENVADSLYFKSDETEGTKVSLILPKEEKYS
ncbi:hypothetical protein DCE79_10580 [Lysinibacillus sp. 2017]|uniref:sensor histidine kinase n=1 Tax=unclassified Lysinibacillus TaxID=2636778 RepID=UPI000D52677B|nr:MULTISPECIES: histidine kinase [unclassified Lysinibacillus]AWE07802.1 hypothetical protein DCE79_10580 [Lysinibacillus sp. 2017]TGN34623.1 sensor histidine kinase [Lysinibacillus sp. S2017]